MRVRAVRFTHGVRTGVKSSVNDLTALDVTDDHLRVGVRGEPGYRVASIDAYFGPGPEGDLPGGETGARYLIIRSPCIDLQTGEPLTVVVPLERVLDCQPLSETQAAIIYPATQPRAPERKAVPRSLA
jgi:hypothetical protein